MPFRIFLFTFFISVTSLIFFPILSQANSEVINSDRFCIQKISAPEGVIGVRDVFQFERSPHAIFQIGNVSKGTSMLALLDGDEFKKINLHIPKKNFEELQNGNILVYGMRGMGDERPLFQLKPNSKTFEKVEADGLDKIFSISTLEWSSPLNGVIISEPDRLGFKRKVAKSGRLYFLQDNKLRTLPQVEGGAASIVDFPELDITFLGTAKKDRIYIIDGNQNIHYLGELNLGKRVFFEHVFYLKNSNQLLVCAKEALGKYRDSFLINLERRDGLFQPSQNQNLRGLKKKCGFIVDIAEELSITLLSNKRVIDLPDSKTKVLIKDKQLHFRDDENNDTLFEQNVVKPYEYDQYSTYLKHQKSLFINAQNGFFLLKDREIHKDGCSK